MPAWVTIELALLPVVALLLGNWVHQRMMSARGQQALSDLADDVREVKGDLKEHVIENREHIEAIHRQDERLKHLERWKDRTGNGKVA